jgi:DNA-binding IclR family transcriptional regulator
MPNMIEKASSKEKQQFITALARGLDILRPFQPGAGPLGNHEIVEFTGLPKPTISRMTYTLIKIDDLNRLPRLGKCETGTPVP